MLTPGQRLQALREEFGFTARDVEDATMKIAARHQRAEFAIPLSRLAEIEGMNVIPGIHSLYSLATIYRRDPRELMAWYAVDVNEIVSDLNVIAPAKSHRAEVMAALTGLQVPIQFEAGFEPRKTTNLGRMVGQRATMPLALLSNFINSPYSYAYVGTDDFTMYPIVPPGAFLQIDESKNEVVNGVWRSEYERPIYFVETRAGNTCSWCTLKEQQLILQSHPLSPVPVRVLEYPKDAEIVGQLVGVAKKLHDWRPCPRPGSAREAVDRRQ